MAAELNGWLLEFIGRNPSHPDIPFLRQTQQTTQDYLEARPDEGIIPNAASYPLEMPFSYGLLNLPTRVYNSLHRFGFDRVDQLIALRDQFSDFTPRGHSALKIREFGLLSAQQTVSAIEAFLANPPESATERDLWDSNLTEIKTFSSLPISDNTKVWLVRLHGVTSVRRLQRLDQDSLTTYKNKPDHMAWRDAAILRGFIRSD